MIEEKKKINFEAVGRNVLIELEKSEERIVKTLDSKTDNIIEPTEAILIVSISKLGTEETGLKEGDFIYLDSGAFVEVRFMTEKKSYALIQLNEIAGRAPQGFDRKAWEEKKDKEKSKILTGKEAMKKNVKGVSAY